MYSKFFFSLFTLASFIAGPIGAANALKESSPNTECVCSPKQISKFFTDVAKKSMPAVVFIKVQSTAEDNNASPFGYGSDPFGDDLFQRFFGIQPQQPQPKQQMSQGSGFIVSPDGYIMTNAHVIKGADKITVVLNDGRELDASLVGSDPHTDIAVVKIDGKNLPFVNLGDSDEMEIGEWVVAIGSPFQLEASLTVGVISAKGRQNLRITDLEDFIQTDAAINPGNSGGPLLNLDSEVIGINTAIVSRSGGYMGIGFAIPSNMAKNIMNQIINNGVVTRGFLGVSLQPVDKDIADAFNLPKAEGVLVSDVSKDSPADKAGVKQGDIILEYNGNTIKSIGGFRNEISMMKPGSVVKLTINRKGKMVMVPVTLGSASDSLATTGGISQKLGIEVDQLNPDVAQQLGYPKEEVGVFITKVKPGSAASMAGIRPGFIILAINHKKVTTVAEFNEVMAEVGNKNRVLILVKQGAMTRFYSIKMD
ncbi:MAG: DegQ family serine endoprotease [Chlamydiae bacterium]|nr:DegQ family serine endoprotease [Chlamydiota bacterium]